MTSEIKRYRSVMSGGAYFDIGSRGDERLAMSIQYGSFKGVGHLLIRFLAVSKNPHFEAFKRFNTRGDKSYYGIGEEGKIDQDDKFKGVQLNKIDVPALSPALPFIMLATVGDQKELWEVLAFWIKQQAEADGFTVTEDLSNRIRGEFTLPDVDPASVKLVLEFPDLPEKGGKTKVSHGFGGDLEEVDVDEDEDDDEEDDETLN